ncbi:MAG: hypothetical protein LHV69_08275 [Elusimicrobia bacterium]|nr:hypothetical protein [Candidatus Obscuribacterium magneticum]
MRRALGLSGLFLSVLLATVLIVSGCAGKKSRLKMGQTQEGEVVEAEGLAAYDANDLISTKRASLVDAQRNAVEKAVGVFVSARTMVEKAIAIENNILAKTDGYVKKYDILSEGVDQGLYKTRIRALVAFRELEADLKEMSLLNMPLLERPRVSVSFDEEVERKPVTEHTAASAFEKRLIDQGYVVVGKERLSEAEVLINGKVSAFPFQSEGLGGFVSYRARLSAQAKKAGSSDVLLSLTKEASGLGGNPELAGLKALETVGELAGEEAANQLNERMKKASTLLVFVEGVDSFATVDRVKKHFLSQPSVSDAVLRLYEETMAQYEVELRPSTRVADLAAQLEASQTLPLKVLETQQNTLRLKL